jgi:hypothetical protein
MLNGIYHVTFSSNSDDFGIGIIVIKNDAINGGDQGYFYTGTAHNQGEQFTATLTVQQWNPSVPSIFGDIPKFHLEINGKYSNGNDFVAHGSIIGHPQAEIRATGKYISQAM